MDNIYHYIAPLPIGVDEAVLPCFDGYTIYTADRLDPFRREIAYNHALSHIIRKDWEQSSVQEIEYNALDTPHD
jgi:hypothetical protein